MIAYFGTSSIVPLLIDEVGTEGARTHWLAADRLVTVRLAQVEVRAALARAARSGRVTAARRRDVTVELPQLFEQLDLIDVDEDLARSAGDLAGARALRAYDAVHLAAALSIASEDLVFVAGDRPLLAAASAAGLSAAETT